MIRLLHNAVNSEQCSDKKNLVQMMVSLPPTSEMYHEKIRINVLQHSLFCIDRSFICNLDVTDDTTEKNNLLHANFYNSELMLSPPPWI